MGKSEILISTGDDFFVDELKRRERELLKEIDPSALAVIDEMERELEEEDDEEE